MTSNDTVPRDKRKWGDWHRRRDVELGYNRENWTQACATWTLNLVRSRLQRDWQAVSTHRVNVLDKWVIRGPGRWQWDGMRFRHVTQNSTQVKTYELYISGIFHLIFLDHSWPQVTEERKTMGEGRLLYGICPWKYRPAGSSQGRMGHSPLPPKTWGQMGNNAAMTLMPLAPVSSLFPESIKLSAYLLACDEGKIFETSQ